MSSPNIPGYYFDKEKQRYFKILSQELPDFISHSNVNAQLASNVNEQTVNQIKDRLRSQQQPFNLLRSLDTRERSLRWSAIDSYSDMMHARVKNWSHKISDNSIGPGRALFTPDGRYLYVLQQGPGQTSLLCSYSTVYDRESTEVEGAFRGGFRADDIAKLSVNFVASSLEWLDPGRKIALLGKTYWSKKAVLHILNVENPEAPHGEESVSLHFDTGTPTQFVTPFTSNSTSYQSGAPVYINGRDEVSGYAIHGARSQLFFPTLSDYSTGRVLRTSGTAWAHTTAPNSTTYNALSGLFYVASSYHGVLWLDLVEAKHRRESSKYLIRFNLTQLQQDKSTNITFLQSLTTASGDRFGLLVGRRSGLLQLWDDRFPAGPAVEYFGSAPTQGNSSLCKVASHLPLRPTASPLDCNMVASPLLASGHIGLWNLRTGQPISTVEIPSRYARPASAAPPQIMFRPNWSDPRGFFSNGPTFLAFDEGTLHWFWEDGNSSTYSVYVNPDQ